MGSGPRGKGGELAARVGGLGRAVRESAVASQKGRSACARPRDWAAGAGVGRAAGRWAAGKGWVGPSAGKGEGVGLGPVGLELLGWVLGFLMGFYFPFLFYSISKTNKQSLNSNTTLNSNHTQIIKTMHQHECSTKI